jgi:hypothetical protein
MSFRSATTTFADAGFYGYSWNTIVGYIYLCGRKVVITKRIKIKKKEYENKEKVKERN